MTLGLEFRFSVRVSFSLYRDVGVCFRFSFRFRLYIDIARTAPGEAEERRGGSLGFRFSFRFSFRCRVFIDIARTAPGEAEEGRGGG